jgi:hypothetical protein
VNRRLVSDPAGDVSIPVSVRETPRAPACSLPGLSASVSAKRSRQQSGNPLSRPSRRSERMLRLASSWSSSAGEASSHLSPLGGRRRDRRGRANQATPPPSTWAVRSGNERRGRNERRRGCGVPDRRSASVAATRRGTDQFSARLERALVIRSERLASRRLKRVSCSRSSRSTSSASKRSASA